MVGLRLLALRSDPYPRLDWSTGLLTDEGFYIHNARNIALFGHLRTDEFNNALLSPLLHFMQVATFSLLGSGSLQARLISVLCSLLTLPLFFAALRRAFDTRLALTGVLFLGLDHTALLYHRMALMDTPASLLAVAAFYAFVRGTDSSVKASGGGRALWLGLCGVFIGLAAITRSLCVYLVGVPLVALGVGRSPVRPVRLVAVAGGLGLVVVVYGLLWYLPYRDEINAMTHYYRTRQIQPHTWAQLGVNLHHGFLGDMFGILPYLFRHTPVLFVLALLGVVFRCSGVQAFGERPECLNTRTPEHRTYLLAWLLLGWLLLIVINYSPSRYYVTTYPALAGIAALSLRGLPQIWARLQARGRTTRLLRGLLLWFVTYHAVQWIVHRGGVVPYALTMALLYGLPTLVGVLDFGFSIFDWLRPRSRTGDPESKILLLWFVVNGLWLGDWLGGLRWSQYEMSRWLGEMLPARSVLLGDVAPGVCLDNGFIAVNVMPGLCNDRQPVEKFAGRPRYIVILDGRKRGSERFWLKNYPDLIAPARRLRFAHVLQWPIGIYPVDESPAVQSGPTTSNTSASAPEASGTRRR